MKSKKHFFLKHKFKILALLGVVVFGVAAVVASPHIVHASGVLDDFKLIIFNFFTLLAQGEAALMDMLSKGFITFTTYQGYFSEDFVRTGWGVIRDFVNLSFILVLMIIALMSILSIEESAVRKLLPRFIFAVLLVNFSFFVTKVIINAADGITIGFAPAINSLGDVLSQYMKAWTAYQIKSSENGSPDTAVLISALVMVVLLGFVVVAMFSITVAMLARIVALCILLILSPVAFLALILPSTSGLASKWMHSVFSYAFWGPAATFFVWLSVITFTSDESQLTKALVATQGSSIPEVGTSSGQLLKFIVVAIFLYVAIIAGKLLGNTGADLGMQAVKAAGGLAAKTAKGIGYGLTTATGTAGLGKEIGKRWEEFRGRTTKARADELSSAMREPTIRAKLKGAKAFLPSKERNEKIKKKARLAREREKQKDYAELTGPEQEAAMTRQSGDMGSLDSMESAAAMLRQHAKQGTLSRLKDSKGNQLIRPGENMAADIQKLGFAGADADEIAAQLSNISRTTDTGDLRYVGGARLDIGGGQGNTDFARNDAVQSGEAISQEVEKRTRKGPGEAKKLKEDVLHPDQEGIHVIAGIEPMTGLDGKPMSLRSSMNGKALNEVRRHGTLSDQDSAVSQINKAIEAAKAANPGMSPKDQKFDVEITVRNDDGSVEKQKISSTVERASEYVKKANSINTDSDAPSQSSSGNQPPQNNNQSAQNAQPNTGFGANGNPWSSNNETR